MKQIIAMGGGGFSMEPDNPLLDEYILSQANKDVPKICFVPTASGDADHYIERFYNAFEEQNCIPSHLSLYSPPARNLKEFILDKDIIYVGGGNTKNLLALWRDWGLHEILAEALEKGIILAGISAGGECWFEEGVTDSYFGSLHGLKCLGYLKGSHCPHYNEPDRRPAYHRLLMNGEIGNGTAADDGAALHYKNGQIFRAVSSRPEAKAYKVELLGERVTETELPVLYLEKTKNED